MVILSLRTCGVFDVKLCCCFLCVILICQVVLVCASQGGLRLPPENTPCALLWLWDGRHRNSTRATLPLDSWVCVVEFMFWKLHAVWWMYSEQIKLTQCNLTVNHLRNMWRYEVSCGWKTRYFHLLICFSSDKFLSNQGIADMGLCLDHCLLFPLESAALASIRT